MKLFNKIKEYFFTKKFITFLFVGVINTVNGTIFSYLLSLFLQTNIAFVTGYIISLTISYFLNTFVVFHDNVGISKYIKFCISYIPNFIIQNICVFVAYNILHIPEILAFILAAAIGVPVTYILLNIVAFRKK